MCNNFFGGNSCIWILVLILILFCCGGCGSNGATSGCGCNDNCGCC